MCASSLPFCGQATTDLPLISPVLSNLGSLHRLLVATCHFYYTLSCATFRFGSWWFTILRADTLPADPPPSSGYIKGIPSTLFRHPALQHTLDSTLLSYPSLVICSSLHRHLYHVSPQLSHWRRLPQFHFLSHPMISRSLGKSAVHGSRMGQLSRGDRDRRRHLLGMVREVSSCLES